MREITSYQAFDGKLFNNKQECLDYENEHYAYRTEISVSLEFLDVSRRRVNCAPAANDSDYEQKLSNAYNLSKYLIIHNDLSDTAINYLNDEMGWNFPCQSGEYRYDGDKDKWIKITDDFIVFCKEWGMTAREMIKRFTP